MRRPAAQPITIPAMAPPERPRFSETLRLLEVPKDADEADGVPLAAVSEKAAVVFVISASVDEGVEGNVEAVVDPDAAMDMGE